jgi:hemoglobin/transferrin/lactoferrin receptor protein
MKKILSFICMSLCTAQSAQVITVRDLSTREPIADVSITDRVNTVQTDQKGKADLSSLNRSGSLFAIHPSFAAREFTVAGDQATAELDLGTRLVALDEVVFSANRVVEKQTEVPYHVEIMKAKDIEFFNQPNAGDMLASKGSITLQKSQSGGGSPNIRGFEASRVLMVIDGVRLNNAIYRAGHVQDVMTIDALMLDRTEVIFGPSSTVYGSDALGGVIHFYTKSPRFGSDGRPLLKTNAMARYGSASGEMTGHVDLNIGLKNFASMTNITHSQFGDTRSGATKLEGYSNAWDRRYYVERRNGRDTMIRNSDDNLLVGSGYAQTDLMQRFSIKNGARVIHDLNFQASLNPYLPRYDRLAGDFQGGSLRWAENGYAQNRLLGSYSLRLIGRPVAFADQITFTGAYQKIDQDRVTRRFRNNSRITQMEDVAVLSVNLDLMKQIAERHELRYGVEMTSNAVESTAKTDNIVTNIETRADTRYAQESEMQTAAGYVSYAFEANPNFVFSGGLRQTITMLRCHFRDTLPFRFPFETAEQNSHALTGNIGFTWHKADDHKVSLLANSGFRSPNVDDMSKLFESGNVLIVANPDVKPEYATNFEASMNKFFGGGVRVDFAAFYTIVENYLTLRDFKFNGQDTVNYSGTKLKVQAMQNTDRAHLYGFNGGLQVEFTENLTMRSTLNYIYGRYTDVKKDTVVPLDHIPPVYGQAGIVYSAKNTDVEFFARFNGRKGLSQYSPSGEDNLQYATPSGMPGWVTLNFRAGYNLTRQFRLNFACENITDNRYRVFASGVNAPGRNFIVSLRYKV